MMSALAASVGVFSAEPDRLLSSDVALVLFALTRSKGGNRAWHTNVRRIPDALALGAGGLLMGIQLARWFGRAYGGH